MALNIPPELKKISPYIRRAEELDKDTGTAESRLVAYYCRQYAVHTGIPLASTSPAAKECLGQLLGALEKEKAAMDNFTKEEAKFLCGQFANRVFHKADEEDRLGLANKGTAKTFYAAASFLQILDQFIEEGDAEMEDIKKRVVYSKWKSTEILKAIKEGRTPTPGGYGEDEEEEAEEENHEEKKGDSEDTPQEVSEPGQPSGPKVDTVPMDEDEPEVKNDLPIPPAPHFPPSAPMEPPASDNDDNENVDEGTEVSLGAPPTYPGEAGEDSSPTPPITFVAPPSPPPSPPPPQPSPPPYEPPAPAPAPAPAPKIGGLFGFGKKKAGKVTKAQLTDAVELTKFALAALEDKDADLAADRLQQALKSLGK